MAAEENKALVRKIFSDVFQEGRIDSVADATVSGSLLASELKKRVAMLRDGFPDLKVKVEDVIAEGDKVRLSKKPMRARAGGASLSQHVTNVR